MLFTVIYAGIGVMMETIVAFLLTMVDQHIYKIAGSVWGHIWGICLSTGLFFLTVCLIWYILKKKLKINDFSQYLMTPYWGTLFLILTLTTMSLSLGINYLTIKRGIENGLLYFFILECLLLFLGIAIFFIFREMEHLQSEKLKAALLKQQNEAQEAFYKESIAKNQQLKKITHDEKNFLLGLVGLLKNQQVPEAINEIEQKVTQMLGNITDYTGIISLDTVLTAKVEEAAQERILLRPAVALYGQICVNLLDLVVLLGNALDNAIEATMQLPDDADKVIHLTLKLQDDFLLIEVRNPVKERIEIQNNSIATTKMDKEFHGLGLENMKLVTEKYHGTLLLECIETTFILRILLENECGPNEIC